MKTRYIHMAVWGVFLPLVLPFSWAPWLYLVAMASVLLGLLHKNIEPPAQLPSKPAPQRMDGARLASVEAPHKELSYARDGLAKIEQEERRIAHMLARSQKHRASLMKCSKSGFAWFTGCSVLMIISSFIAWTNFSQAGSMDDSFMNGLLWLILTAPFALGTLLLSMYPLERAFYWSKATLHARQVQIAQKRLLVMRSDLALEQGSLTQVTPEEAGRLQLIDK